ncbi:MAG TPA: GMC family oxidoreductase N-terminal domain-containing protein [Acetobacteraceae bacterium]|jgi:choline dehydrogenase|nr:GMC family oxidoreductase N-terminal domain-containing protein [Acetobacteraceae bacterium]
MALQPDGLAGESFDYVIVGSGAAGSVLAARLTEDPGVTVCVLECGPPDRHPFIHIPGGFMKLLFHPAYTWQFKTEPSEGTAGRQISTTQGRTLGGSSSINGMVYNRGQRADFDSWAQRGNRGWGYDDVLPYFRRTEHRISPGGDDRVHGREGALPVTDMDWFHPVCEAFIAGAIGMGIPRCADYNSGDHQEGVGYFQRAIYRGYRHSAARVFLHPARASGRLDIRTDARAAQVLFDGKRAVGVQYIDDRDRTTQRIVRARREVILSCGTANTAKLLQISGVGPAALLRELGMPVIADLPVGESFRDHYSVRIVARVKNIRTINEMSRGLGLAGQVLRWVMGRPSILAVTPSLVHWFWKSHEALDFPDMQGVFTPASYKEGFIGLLDDYPGMTAGVWQHRPESTGYVRARSTDPFQDPVIQPNYLSDPMDRRVLLAGMKLARRLLHTPELAPYFDGDTLPGRDVQSDDELLDYARHYGSTAYHLIGTARMGPASDRTSVVDDQLRVHGLDGLRVVDASIMPSMPSANTYCSTMMIAEKASDMILGRAPLSPAEPLAA